MFGLISKKKHEAEVAALKAEADEYRAAYFSNIDRFTALTLEHDALEAELANWRAYGQMRDPKTGRLIPRKVAS